MSPRKAVVDLATWERAEHFRFFQRLPRPQVSFTAPVAVHALLAHRAAQRPSDGGAAGGYRLTDAVYFGVMRAVNAVEEFRTRLERGHPVVYDRIDAGFTYVPAGRRLHANCVARYAPEFAAFRANVDAARAAADTAPTLSPPGAEHPALVYMSCVPGLAFTSFTNPWGDPATDSVPRIVFGKAQDGVIPVAVEALHSLMDGAHIQAFYAELAAVLAAPETYFTL